MAAATWPQMATLGLTQLMTTLSLTQQMAFWTNIWIFFFSRPKIAPEGPWGGPGALGFLGPPIISFYAAVLYPPIFPSMLLRHGAAPRRSLGLKWQPSIAGHLRICKQVALEGHVAPEAHVAPEEHVAPLRC